MIKPLLIVLGIGAVLGLMAPNKDKAAPPTVTATTGSVEKAVDDEPVEDTVLEKRGNGHFYVDAEVNGELVNFVVDTGASTVVLTIDDARRIGIPVSETGFTVIAQGASGPVRGQVIDLASVSVDGKTVTGIRGAVVEGLSVSLLGQSYLSRIGSVQMAGDTMTLN